MAEQVAWYDTRPQLQNEILGLQSDTEAYAGHEAKAREMTRAATESAVRTDNKESAALWLVTAAWREALVGNFEEARRDVEKSLELAPDSRDARVLGALTLARAADVAHARSMAQKVGQQYQAHTLVQSYWLPLIDAQSSLSTGQAQNALDQMQRIVNLDFSLAFSSANSSCAYPNYLRGEAFLAAGQSSAAAAEFQKIIDHPGLVWNCVTGALAHLELGRADALAGDKAKARAAYQDFFNLWKDADPDIPVLKEAKAEFTKLQ
jgi:tetratricopeptide (TPR) repeat protein